MQQLSGSSGFGGTHIPAIKVLFFASSERRSRGEESRLEKRIEGPVSSGTVEGVLGVDIGGLELGEAVVGGLLVTTGVEYSRREA